MVQESPRGAASLTLIPGLPFSWVLSCQVRAPSLPAYVSKRGTVPGGLSCGIVSLASEKKKKKSPFGSHLRNFLLCPEKKTCSSRHQATSRSRWQCEGLPTPTPFVWYHPDHHFSRMKNSTLQQKPLPQRLGPAGWGWGQRGGSGWELNKGS